MRKALFAVMLIGASFAGGAVVNGPGLQWAQTTILNYLNGDEDEDSDSDSGNEDETKVADAEKAPPSHDGGQETEAPILSDPAGLDGNLTLKSAPTENVSSGTKTNVAESPATASTSRTDAGRTAVGDRAQPAASKAKAEEPPTAGAALSLLGEALRPKQQPVDDPEIALATVPTPHPAGAPEPLDPLPLPGDHDPGASANATAPGARQADSSNKAPAPLNLLGSGSPPSASTAPEPAAAAEAAAPATKPTPEKAASGTPRPASDWTELRRRMAALGVSRYGIEGEPNGRVRFHCIIPLAGRRAVAQQFEAEGDDELQAAEVALRRVALWRATENRPEP